MYIYVDDSIRAQAGFIISAVVATDADPTVSITSALRQAGLEPGIEEFKSGAHMISNRRQQDAREQLLPILQKAKVGVVVTSLEERPTLGNHVLVGVSKMLVANGLLDRNPRISLDTGILCSTSAIETFRATAKKCELLVEQDSRTIVGIQLADLAAHVAGSMLLDELGILRKTVKARPNDGYGTDQDLDLGFALWATVRRSFFRAPEPYPDPISGDPIGNLEFDVANYGLYVSEGCPDRVRRAAFRRFGKFYLGCIH